MLTKWKRFGKAHFAEYFCLKFLNPCWFPMSNTEGSPWSKYQPSPLPPAAYVTFWTVKLILAITLPVALKCWSSLLTIDRNTPPTGFRFIGLPADLLSLPCDHLPRLLPVKPQPGRVWSASCATYNVNLILWDRYDGTCTYVHLNLKLQLVPGSGLSNIC